MLPKSNLEHRAIGFRRRLTAWYRKAARDLPWRRTRDPYAVVVSEFMLQQTQVSRVLGFYPRFLARYPTLADLARARPAAVREAWDGLGYYRRATNLLRLARVVQKDYAGSLPSDVNELRKLPGVGQYTAGAVACFAFEQAAPTIDTNVGRVLGRVFEGRKNAGKEARSIKRLTALARRVQPARGKAVWTFNQAVMELGALVCTAKKPNCPACPVKRDCRWNNKSKSPSPPRNTWRPES
jgi:A/G-specific adenine glycosylase